jgi:hypothetical protein
MTEEQILVFALPFRRAIQSMSIEEFPNSNFFLNFPRGCCGDTSHLFAKFLSKRGISTKYVWGINSNDFSHAWLEYDDIIIDLTADQFQEINEEVVITRNRKWYEQFVIQGKYISDFEKFNDYNARRLGAIYKNIIKRLGIIE